MVDINNNSDVIRYIEENQRKSTQYNRQHYGEVFTPAILINEILDNLPIHVWNEPTYTWLDPCAGVGNFVLLVYGRLMEGLSKKIPNPHLRQKHILSKMLYMNDYNPENTKMLISIFGVEDTHITTTDFLKKERGALHSRKYNIILENPPYQIPVAADYKGGRRFSTTLWDKFIAISFELLDETAGWMGAITPANWRRPGHLLYDSVIAPHLTYLHIYSKADGIRLFGAQTRFDIYVISKKTGEKARMPTIVDELGNIHKNISPSKWVFLPNYNYKGVGQFFSLKKGAKGVKVAKGTQKVLYDSNEYNSKSLSKKKTAKYKYPVVHTITRKGLGVRWSAKKRGHFGVPKILLNFNEKQYPYNDWKGEYGMSQITFGIPIKSKKEGDSLVKTINTDEFKEVVKATKWGSFQTDYKMFEYLQR
jgi:hypothetical protein